MPAGKNEIGAADRDGSLPDGKEQMSVSMAIILSGSSFYAMISMSDRHGRNMQIRRR